jgi:peptidoglycan/LPS O-acetylase OafA/YrhL
MKYRADIDGLRALAVVLVLVFHFDLLGLGAGGFIGVDLFFVISGYLISTIVWRALDEGRFSLRHFYAQRIRRLAPALMAVQLVVFVGAFVCLLPGEVLGFIKESVFAQAYLSNFYYWQISGDARTRNFCCTPGRWGWRSSFTCFIRFS